ncbi:NB-ARC domain-containing protein [Planctomycetota bacterium]
MVRIRLTDRRISYEFEPGRRVDLLFEGADSYFYLLFTVLIAQEMQSLALDEESMPLVPFTAVAPTALRLARRVKERPFRNPETMASTIYQTWRRRMCPGVQGPFYCVPRATGDVVGRVASLFQLEAGKAGTRAAYRLGVAVGEIEIEDPEVLGELLEEPGRSMAATVRGLVTNHIPAKPYYGRLARHEHIVKAGRTALETAKGGSLNLIWGMGGIGKSTLAAEIARRVLDAEWVEGVFWVQQQTGGAGDTGEAISLLSEVANALVSQLGLLERENASLDTKVAGIIEDDNLSRALLVIDNLDIGSRAEDIAAVLETLRPRATLITSRPALSITRGRSIRVPELDTQDGVTFLRQDAERRGLESALPSSDADLVGMCEAVGGIPFALQLALGHATRLPWRQVIERLSSAHEELYYYLFRDLWRGLSPTCQKALIYMRTSPESICLEELLAARKIGSRDAVIGALDELVRLALVDVRELDEQTGRYCIHPLTHNFIVSDLPRVWREEDDGRPR